MPDIGMVYAPLHCLTFWVGLYTYICPCISNLYTFLSPWSTTISISVETDLVVTQFLHFGLERPLFLPSWRTAFPGRVLLVRVFLIHIVSTAVWWHPFCMCYVLSPCSFRDLLCVFRCQQMICPLVLLELNFIVIPQLSSTRIFTCLYRFIVLLRDFSGLSSFLLPFETSIIWNFALLSSLFLFTHFPFCSSNWVISVFCLFSSLVHSSTPSTVVQVRCGI